MDKEFELFIRERKFVQNISKSTIEFYEYSYRTFKKHSKVTSIEELNKTALSSFVANMRESGMSAGNTDARIRGINPFLTWLYENDLIKENLKIKKPKLEQKVMKTFTEPQLKAIITYKPKDKYELRLHTILLLLADTGIRINEATTITRNRIDFDNLLITVLGKGNKERIIPFSVELRKSLFKYSKSHKFDLLFPNKYGGKLLYDNLRREFRKLIQELGINGFDGSFHCFRRSFAKNFVRSGGNLFYLQKLLGHTTLTMSRRYVELEIEDVQKEQQRTSLLNRLR